MDYSKMFDTAPSKPTKEFMQFGNLFENQKEEKPVYKDIFASQDTNPQNVDRSQVSSDRSQNSFKGKTLFVVSEEEQLVSSLDNKLSYHSYLEWKTKWDVKFDEVSKGNQSLSNRLLDVTQDISRHDSKQENTFTKIMDVVNEINERVSPKEVTKFGVFKSVIEPAPLEKSELHDFVDRIQTRLNVIEPEIDPFAKQILKTLSEECDSLIREADQGIRTLAVLILQRGDEDQINRRIERLTKVQKLIQISKLSIETTSKSIEERYEQLKDFKGIVVPTMLSKLTMFIQNGADNKTMSTALESLLNLKLKG